MATFVTSEGFGQQVWSGKVIRNCICIGWSGYPLGRLFYMSVPVIHGRLARLMLEM